MDTNVHTMRSVMNHNGKVTLKYAEIQKKENGGIIVGKDVNINGFQNLLF